MPWDSVGVEYVNGDPFYGCCKRYSEHLSNCGQATHDEIANWCIPSHDEAVKGQGVDS